MCFRNDSLHERVGVVTFSKLESGSCDALYVMLDTLLGLSLIHISERAGKADR